MMQEQRERRKGYLHLTVAALTCPCHVPIYLAIFGGTAVGAFLRENLSLFLLGLTGIFLITVVKGLKLVKEEKAKREHSDRL